MGDAGLEPATSALSRRNRAGRRGDQAARFGTKRLQTLGTFVPCADRFNPPMPVVMFENCSNDRSCDLALEQTSGVPAFGETEGAGFRGPGDHSWDRSGTPRGTAAPGSRTRARAKAGPLGRA
jgi:hypothetical protein